MGCRSDVRAAGATILLASLAACSTSLPSAPPPIEVIAGANQQATVGTAVPTPPKVRVRDASGALLAGVVVRFTVTGGGGVVTGDSVVTDANGEAAASQWRLGTIAGGDTLRVTAAGVTATATVVATALAGSPTNMTAFGPQQFLAVVGQVVTPGPAVLVTDAFGNPVPGVTVTFSTTSSDGFPSASTSKTDAMGHAPGGSWLLGGAIGTNQDVARTTTGQTVVFQAQGVAVAPVMTAAIATTQTGYFSFPVPLIPRVLVKDGVGHPVPNVPVRFTLASGDPATLTSGLAVTGTDGIAAPGDWRLGASAVPSVVTATIPGLGGAPIQFTATGSPLPPFVIDVHFITGMNAPQRDAFVAAALRWMSIVTAPLTTTPVNVPAGACADGLSPAINESVSGVLIYAQVAPIDGPNGVLGFAGPCLTRTGTQLPLVGSMTFDVADLTGLVVTNQLTAVITHEMGHVLGFGTLWYIPSLTQGIGGTDPIYIGPAALALWPTFSLGYSGQPVPLENLFGAGTRDSHWRESVFDAELMTGFIESPGVPMPLSKLTIAVLQDLGYQVNYGAADPFAGNLRAPGSLVSAPKQRLVDSLLFPVGEIGAGGVFRRIR